MANKEFWLITGGQHLYGTDAFAEMNSHSEEIAAHLSSKLPFKVVSKGLVTLPDEIKNVITEANYDKNCIGVIMWMHVFSPSKMWIAGLKALQKPMLHLHTQYNREIPWDSIDMDFMNLNQSAHGDREHGFIVSRMGIRRKVVVGHWQNDDVIGKVDSWMRAASAWDFSQNLKVARFGDNMREVAVTEGDKVEAQMKLGWSVNGYGMGDLVEIINAVSDEEIEAQLKQYEERYEYNTTQRESVRVQAKYEVGMRKFLEQGGFGAFTTTFEDLHGLRQLPGLAVQNMLRDGYGFGAEGDWKTSALTAVMKHMAQGLKGGTVFMEDYTYHLEKGKEMVLGAHMLEVCPTIADDKPKIEVHPLGIGGKEDPARLVFNGQQGKAVAATLLDMGSRFRLLVSVVDLEKVKKKMPKLPVARVLWKPLPSLATSAEAWILAGGAHHTCLSNALTVENLRDFAEIAGIECLVIDENTNINDFKKEILYNEVAYKLGL